MNQCLHLHLEGKSATILSTQSFEIKMPDQANVFCGFADVNGHYMAKNIEQLRDYNIDTGLYPNINIPESIFKSQRLRFLKYLKTE